MEVIGHLLRLSPDGKSLASQVKIRNHLLAHNGNTATCWQPSPEEGTRLSLALTVLTVVAGLAALLLRRYVPVR
jgi:hypothetical protein